ncbi:hypothetical protein, partial [Frankia sp. CcWB3]
MSSTTVLFDVSNITRDGSPGSFAQIGLGCAHGARCPRRCGVTARLFAVEAAARRAFGADAAFRYVADNSLRGLLDGLAPLQRYYRDGALVWAAEADDILLEEARAVGGKVVSKDNFYGKRNIDAHEWIQGDASTFFGWKVLPAAPAGENVKLVRRAMNRIDTVTWERAARQDEVKASGLRGRPEVVTAARANAYRCVTPDCVNARLGPLVSPPMRVAGRGQGARLVCPLCRRPVQEIETDTGQAAGDASGAAAPETPMPPASP